MEESKEEESNPAAAVFNMAAKITMAINQRRQTLTMVGSDEESDDSDESSNDD